MRKTRQLIGKTLLATIALLVLCSPLMKSASAITIYDIPAATIFMDPFRVEGTAGEDVTVYAWIKDVPAPPTTGQLFAFQVGLLFDPNVVSCTSVEEGGFLSNHGANSLLAFPGTIDNVNGIVYPYGWTLMDTAQSKYGIGILANFTFHMEATGYSDLHISGFSAIDETGINDFPITCVDYYTAIWDSTQYIVKIVGNAHGQNLAYGGYSAHAVQPIDETVGPTNYVGELSFNVNGYTSDGDAFAYFNVTIPKALMTCDNLDDWYVQLDGVAQASVASENSTHAIVSLEFTYSDADPVKTVKIWSTTFVPEFSSVFFATLLVLATFAAAIFGKATWSAKRKS